MNFGYWCDFGNGTFWIFPLFCMIFMAVMMIVMFRGGCCMPMRRRGAAPKSDSAKDLPYSGRSES
jgi:uncharacterized membrane protein